MKKRSFYFDVLHSAGAMRHKVQCPTEIVVGRAPDVAQLVLDSEAVSRKHLLLSFSETGVRVMDCGSTNGTLLSNQPLPPHQWVNWTGGVLVLGGLRGVKLSWVEIGEDRPIDTAPNRPGGRSGKGLRALLANKKVITIGRSLECDWVLPEVMVSREHARVTEVQGQVWIEDLHSTNGTYINGRPISKKTALAAGDKVLIGTEVFMLEEGDVTKSEFAIVAEGISKVFSNGVCGLQDTTIKLPFQQFVALMGPSGCGKSTLLKALNGDSPPTSGRVTIFNLDLHANFEAIKHVIGYVPQENIVHDQLTVQESLYYAARIRLPEDTTELEIERRIDEVLGALKIEAPHLRTTPISKLSGGQKKRVCIAVELLTKPKVLFLDEPTSPLDPETIEEFLSCIQSLCKQGTTVVMVTHKPEDLNYVDRVVFMGVNGHLSYDGSKADLLTYFRKENIIQLYTLLSDKQQAARWHEQWFKNESKPAVAFRALDLPRSHANPFKQFYWLSLRYLNIKFANTGNMVLMAAQPVFIAGLVVVSYPELTQWVEVPGSPQPAVAKPEMGVLFLTAIASIWFGVSNSAKEIVGEWEVAQREFRVNVMLGPYLLSKQVVLTLISAVQILLFLCVLGFYYEDLNNLWTMFGALLLVGSTAIQFGLLLSTYSRTEEEVMSSLPLALMPQIILAGFLAKLSTSVTVVLSALTLGRWSTEVLARIQDEEEQPSLFTDEMEKLLYPADVELLESGSIESNMFALVLLYVLMLVAISIRLYRRARPLH